MRRLEKLTSINKKISNETISSIKQLKDPSQIADNIASHISATISEKQQIFETFDVKDKNVITSDYFFPMYQVFSDLYQTELKKAKYTGMKLSLSSIIKLIDKDTQFIIIANPNSPLGDVYKKEQLVPNDSIKYKSIKIQTH